jgi:hypothetical protein
MALAPLNIPAGVVKTATPLQTKGRYWDANLVRWRSNKLLPVGGWQRINATPLDTPPLGLFSWNTNIGTSLTLIGCADKLYALQAATYTDITPTGYVGPETGGAGGYGAWTYGSLLYGDDTDPTYPRPESFQFFAPFSWTFDNWGGDALLVSSSDGRLLHYGEGEDQAHPVGYNSIATAVRVSNIVTITTDHHHGFVAGQSVTITGTSVGSMNGTFTIATVPTESTFTYSKPGTNASGTGGVAQSAAGDLPPLNNRGVIVTPERYAVLYGAGGNTRRVAWSASEDYTNWNFADPAITAGYLDLDTASQIIMATAVREGTLIWTQDEAWLMRYIGLPYIYSIERIGFGCGLMSPKSYATFAGRCIWMGREGFWIYDGGTARPLPCDVGAFVFEDIDTETGPLYSCGSDNSVFPEVWFWYPSVGQTFPNKYVCFSYAESWWSIGSMQRTAAQGAGVFAYPMTADTAGYLYFQENGWTDAGDPITTDRYAETGSINITNGGTVSHIKQAITDSGYGYDSTQLTFFSSYTPEGAEYTAGPFNPRSDGYCDMRVSGRDFRIKIASTADAEWSIGEMRIEMTGGGGR